MNRSLLSTNSTSNIRIGESPLRRFFEDGRRYQQIKDALVQELDLKGITMCGADSAPGFARNYTKEQMQRGRDLYSVLEEISEAHPSIDSLQIDFAYVKERYKEATAAYERVVISQAPKGNKSPSPNNQNTTSASPKSL